MTSSKKEEASMERLRACIRDVPDFPKPGIIFKDITPLLMDKEAFGFAIREMANRVREMNIDKVVAIESRGFIFGSALAFELGAGLVITRKPNKLPYKTTRIEYALEYGTDSLEMHVDAIQPTDRVLIVDDVLATGGTASATVKLVEKMKGKVAALAFLSELSFLKGRLKLRNYQVIALLNL